MLPLPSDTFGAAGEVVGNVGKRDERKETDRFLRFSSYLNSEGLLERNYEWFHSRYLTISPKGQYLRRSEDQARPKVAGPGGSVSTYVVKT